MTFYVVVLEIVVSNERVLRKDGLVRRFVVFSFAVARECLNVRGEAEDFDMGFGWLEDVVAAAG